MTSLLALIVPPLALVLAFLVWDRWGWLKWRVSLLRFRWTMRRVARALPKGERAELVKRSDELARLLDEDDLP